MKNQTAKKLIASIIMVMFSFSFVNGQQPCNGNKIRVYKCSNNNCHSKCVNAANIPIGWSTSMAVCLSCSGLSGGGKRLSQDSNISNELIDLNVAPNPVISSTAISFFLSQSQKVSLKIYDMSGRLVTTLADGLIKEGENKMEWNVNDANAGIYFLRMQAGDYSETQKLSILK